MKWYGGRVGRANAKPTGSMPVIHSRKTSGTTHLRKGSFDVFAEVDSSLDVVGFAFGSTHPTAICHFWQRKKSLVSGNIINPLARPE